MKLLDLRENKLGVLDEEFHLVNVEAGENADVILLDGDGLENEDDYKNSLIINWDNNSNHLVSNKNHEVFVFRGEKLLAKNCEALNSMIGVDNTVAIKNSYSFPVLAPDDLGYHLDQISLFNGKKFNIHLSILKLLDFNKNANWEFQVTNSSQHTELYASCDQSLKKGEDIIQALESDYIELCEENNVLVLKLIWYKELDVVGTFYKRKNKINRNILVHRANSIEPLEEQDSSRINLKIDEMTESFVNNLDLIEQMEEQNLSLPESSTAYKVTRSLKDENFFKNEESKEVKNDNILQIIKRCTVNELGSVDIAAVKELSSISSQFDHEDSWYSKKAPNSNLEHEYSKKLTAKDRALEIAKEKIMNLVNEKQELLARLDHSSNLKDDSFSVQTEEQVERNSRNTSTDNSRYLEIQEKCNRIQEELAEQTRKLNISTNGLNETQEENRRLESQVSSLKSELTEIGKRTARQFEEALYAKTKEIDYLKKQIESLRAGSSGQGQSSKAVAQEVKRYERLYNKVAQENKKYNSEVLKLKQAALKAKMEAKNLKIQIKNMELKLNRSKRKAS